MVQPAVYNITEDDMKNNDYGSILSTVGCIDSDAWCETVDGFQNAAIESEAGIPYIYGQDDVHGVNYCRDAVYFPHNIGQGAANDEELAYQQECARRVRAMLSGETAFVDTYGCQQNEADSERLAGMLSDMGYIKCVSEQDADIILFL